MTYRPHKNGVDDLVLLTDMSNEAINSTLSQHFSADEIYVYIGHVLVSLNPYKEIRGLYGEGPLKKYKGRLPYENPPHVYALAEGVHRTMIQQRDNHCVIISGESGAGKTENSKKIMEYIAFVSSKAAGVVKVKEQILESNPLLEAFGNAKTLRNDNSSRFGKYFEIQFNFNGDPVGGKIRNYLLEKIRVVQQQQGERNFHIFYQLLAGASATEKKDLELYAPKYYRFLNQSGCYDVNGINDARDYSETRHAMDVIGMTQEEQAEVFRMVASILHVGNLEFKQEAKGAVIENTQILDIAARVLRVTPDSLKKALTTKTITTRTETIGSPLNSEEATYSRNSLAKTLYGKLFDWIVLRSNDLMFREDHEGFLIGVLDIYGFEIFDRNSFEQLCINFCNEKLHQIFIELTLKAEQEEYKKEQIKWEDVAYYNNKPCVELIEKKNGVLGYLDEECLFPKGTDFTFHEKLFANIKGQANFAKSPLKNCFVIVHYAGEVTYAVEGFLDKNKDLLFPDIISMLANSQSSLLKSLFQRDLALLKENNKRPITAGTQFRNQMSSLMDSLRACTPHYIRCIKPNTNKRSGEWNSELTSNQIKYLGLLENVRVRRAGYAFRLPYGQFLRRYKMLSPKTWPSYRGDEKEGCKLLISEIQINDAAFGVSKAFIKSPETVFKLEEMREKALDVIVVKIQRCWRAFQARKWYLELRAAMQDIFYGKKQRRKKSLNRKYYGDYLRIQNEPSFKAIMAKFGDSSVLFADNVWKTNRKYKREKRVMVITDRSFYILKPGKRVAVKQRYEIRDVSKVALSTLADDFFFVNFGAFDVIFENARKTEICVCLKEHLAKQGKTLQIIFSDEISFNMKDNKRRVFNFETADGQPEGGVLVAKGERGTVRVPKGLDAHTNPSNTYVKKGQRGAAGGQKTAQQPAYGQSDAPSWGGAQSAVAKKAPPPQPTRVKSMIQLQTAICLFDYKSQANDELDLKEGDVVEIVSKDASGWWTGRFRGKQGLFPGNYVKEQASGPAKTDRANYPYGV